MIGKEYVYVPDLKQPIATGARIRFLRDGEISEGYATVTAVSGKQVFFDGLPDGIREGDELISLTPDGSRL